MDLETDRGTTTDRDRVAQALRAVNWHRLEHAGGPASDVPALLYAVTFGTDPVREHAWWELGGTVHHQGTVYSATAPTLPFLSRIATTPTHPDRVNALCLLWAAAVGEGDSTVHAAASVEAAVLIEAAESQPELVQRALLLLASAFPGMVTGSPGLDAIVPSDLRPAWNRLLAVGPDVRRLEQSDDLAVAQFALQSWAFEGWYPALEGLPTPS